MMLVEETQVPNEALPVEALRRHLRLGTGFAEDDVQDAVLASFLRAAFAAIEARTDKILLSRGFVLTLRTWSGDVSQRLPVAPVSALTSVTRVDRFGVPQELDLGGFRLVADAQSPRLISVSGGLPWVPSGGTLELRFTAGFGASVEDVPADLMQAVLLLAAHYYEYRDATALGQGCMPFGVTSLLARYRPMRLGLGT
ncbi:MAG: hypothetical protein JXQ89_06370 [Pelagimonas sp.]